MANNLSYAKIASMGLMEKPIKVVKQHKPVVVVEEIHQPVVPHLPLSEKIPEYLLDFQVNAPKKLSGKLSPKEKNQQQNPISLKEKIEKKQARKQANRKLGICQHRRIPMESEVLKLETYDDYESDHESEYEFYKHYIDDEYDDWYVDDWRDEQDKMMDYMCNEIISKIISGQ